MLQKVCSTYVELCKKLLLLVLLFHVQIVEVQLRRMTRACIWINALAGRVGT